MRSCNAGGKKSIDACHNVGLLAHDGRAMEGGPDLTAARQYYEKACAGGFAPSCFNLSALYIEGTCFSLQRVNENVCFYTREWRAANNKGS